MAAIYSVYRRGLKRAGLSPGRGGGAGSCCSKSTHRLLSSSCLGLPYRILFVKHKKELLRSLWVPWQFLVG